MQLTAGALGKFGRDYQSLIESVDMSPAISALGTVGEAYRGLLGSMEVSPAFKDMQLTAGALGKFGRDYQSLIESVDMSPAISALGTVGEAYRGLLGSMEVSPAFKDMQLTAGALTSFSKSVVAGTISEVLRTQDFLESTIRIGLDVSGWWKVAAAAALPSVSQIASDLAWIGDSLGSSREIAKLYGPPLGMLSSGVASATAWYAPVSLAHISGEETPGFGTALGRPLDIASGFVGSSRAILTDADEGDDFQPAGSAEHIEARLRSLHEVAAEDWMGADSALADGRPGWARAAAHLAREAFLISLEQLSPLAKAGPDGKTHRSTRVSEILRPHGKALTNWGISIARAVDDTYALLSAEAHNRTTPRLSKKGMAALMKTTEGLLLLLIDLAENRDPDRH